MALNYYLEKSESGLLKQKKTFSKKLGDYAPDYGLTQLQVDSDNNDTIYLEYMLDSVEFAKTRTKQKVEAKDIFVWGKVGMVKPAMHNYPPITPPEVTVEPGIVQRFIKLVRYIKNHFNYTTDAGKDLGIEGSEIIVNLDNVTPEISKVVVMSDKVVIDFVLGEMHGVQVYTSYDGAEWTKFEKDYRSPWEDFRKNQSAGVEKRYYKFYYIFADEEVGKASNIIEVLVDIH